MHSTALPRFLRVAVNVETRKGVSTPDMLILHYTGMQDAARACDWLCAAESKVSCHYLIDEMGQITQMVDEDLRAWHAGESSWEETIDINSRSIGIEIQNPGHGLGYPEFPLRQLEATGELALDIVKRHGIAAHHVLGHSDVAPGRKVDPGERFDWALMHRMGVGHWVEPEPVGGGTYLQHGDSGDAVLALQAMLKNYGYGLNLTGVFDARTKVVVEAFQRHFRQALVDGIADQSTITTLHRLTRSKS